jgi:nicotinate phosphoribosyltransferase
MVEYDGRPVMKLSSAKVTAPGPKQVFRRAGYADVIGLADEQPPDGGRPLLETVMRGGQRTGTQPTLDECRERFTADLGGLPSAARRIRAPVAPRATASEQLSALAARVRRRIEEQAAAASARSSVPARTVSGPHGSVSR